MNDRTAPGHFTALGLMSGTSLDGIDAAVITTDGRQQVTPLGFRSRDYPPAFRQRLKATLGGKGAVAEVARIWASMSSSEVTCLPGRISSPR